MNIPIQALMGLLGDGGGEGFSGTVDGKNVGVQHIKGSPDFDGAPHGDIEVVFGDGTHITATYHQLSNTPEKFLVNLLDMSGGGAVHFHTVFHFFSESLGFSFEWNDAKGHHRADVTWSIGLGELRHLLGM